MSTGPGRSRASLLAQPGLRSALDRFVRARVPAVEADDVVQATITDALASATAPEDPGELLRWVHGVARHKIADYYRRSRREEPVEPADVEATAAQPPAEEPHELLRWAENELPPGDDGKKTLQWMLREGDGEKLEAIAAEERVPAPRVRQRVSRLRRHFRSRWAAQLAAVAAVLAVIVLAVLWVRRAPAPVAPRPEPSLSPERRGVELRRLALESCAAGDWTRCLEGLDAAKGLDPAGDQGESVTRARKAAQDALTPPPPTTAPVPPRAVKPSADLRAPDPSSGPAVTKEKGSAPELSVPPKAPLPPKATPAPTTPPPPPKPIMPPQGSASPFGGSLESK